MKAFWFNNIKKKKKKNQIIGIYKKQLQIIPDEYYCTEVPSSRIGSAQLSCNTKKFGQRFLTTTLNQGNNWP